MTACSALLITLPKAVKTIMHMQLPHCSKGAPIHSTTGRAYAKSASHTMEFRGRGLHVPCMEAMGEPRRPPKHPENSASPHVNPW